MRHTPAPLWVAVERPPMQGAPARRTKTVCDTVFAGFPIRAAGDSGIISVGWGFRTLRPPQRRVPAPCGLGRDGVRSHFFVAATMAWRRARRPPKSPLVGPTNFWDVVTWNNRRSVVGMKSQGPSSRDVVAGGMGPTYD